MRKVVSCKESVQSSIVVNAAKRKSNKRLLRDMLYYIRKLLKLAQRAQQIGVLEGYDSVEDKSILEEFEVIKKEVSAIEKYL